MKNNMKSWLQICNLLPISLWMNYLFTYFQVISRCQKTKQNNRKMRVFPSAPTEQPLARGREEKGRWTGLGTETTCALPQAQLLTTAWPWISHLPSLSLSLQNSKAEVRQPAFSGHRTARCARGGHAVWHPRGPGQGQASWPPPLARFLLRDRLTAQSHCCCFFFCFFSLFVGI